ncbi:Myosin-like protein [Globisporangium polare]
MDVGAEVEVRVGGVWTPGIVIDRYVSPIEVSGAVATIKFDDGTVTEMNVPEDPTQPMANLRLLSGATSDALDVDDLTSLLELDEGAILAALECRFMKQKIYTNTGAILLAVNPFQKLRGLYERNVMYAYLQSYETRQSHLKGSKMLPPHIYQVAGEAYKAMLLGLNGVQNDQSILVSGESGSGKTESTKFLMEYLAQAGDNQTTQSLSASRMGQVGIAAKVLQTNTLLESFGNARTLRNDNSSRFGKFIKLHFTSGGRLTGASIQTYLLEKVRLVSQSIGERNYHIFYEMSIGASPAARKRWQLDPPSGQNMPSGDYGDVSGAAKQFLHYRYLNQSQCFKRRDGIEDKEMFQRVVDAMEVVGFTNFERAGIFDLLAALMHIGNLEFEHDENSDRQSAAPTKQTFETDLAPNCIWSRDAAASLLTVDAVQLEKALSVRKIRAGTDFVSVKLSAEQANNARDALAKALYGRLFEWMVGKVNEFLKMDDSQKAKGGMHFIGILDIFGFEVFPKNSFEQLCINFANETLQQQFNEYVFKMEQQEYESQGVDWKYIEYSDNQDCVNLISQRPTGILPLVDEECLIPKGNDTTFASKLYRAWEGHARFSASRMQKASGNFTIVHYAGNVEYSSVGFLEKNKDVLHQEAVDLLVYSPQEGSFTRTLCEGIGFRARAKSSPRQRAAASKQRGASVGLQFKEQLTALLETLQTTNPHYVRCLKPNDVSRANTYDRERVLNQLRCNGVMEAVRVARAGLPIRMPHDEFVGRYFSLKRAKNPLAIKKPGVTTSFGLGDEDSQASMLAGEAKELLKDLLTILPKEHDSGSSQSPFEHSDQVQFATRCMAVGVQMGISKMFLKKNTYDFLEELRTQRLRRHMVKIFHAMLCFFARSRYLKLRHAIQSVQVSFRYKRRVKENRKQRMIAIRRKNGRIVQGFLRMVTQRNKYRRFITVVHMLQWRFRYRRMLRAVRLAERDNQERKRREKQQQRQQQQQPIQYNDSYTASSESSSEASLTSNDVEGSNSSQYSDDFNSSNDTFPKHGLKTVDEQSNQLMPRRQSHFIGRPSQAIDNLRPIGHHPNHRMSRTYSDNLHPNYQGGQGNFMPGRASGMPPRKSSFRSTRSSRAVALPRLDVVQQTQWVNDEDRFSCHICNKRFNMFKRKHHCRACGEVICNSCSLYHRIQSRSMRVCVSCVAFHSLESPTSTASTSAFSRIGGSGSQGRKNSTASNFEPGRSSTLSGQSGQSGQSWLNPWPEPPFPDDEEERLAVLKELNIRELATSGKFNMYCEVAAKTMKCPIAYVSIIEDEEQILVANIGMAHTTLPRELSFCAHTICQPSVLVVLDTKNDDRFRENPMVKGDKGAVKIRYYAGATIFSRDGHALGTVAVFDTKPRREADQEHIGMLQHLSFLASEKMTQSTIQEDSDSEFL